MELVSYQRGDDMAVKWVTRAVACQVNGISERTLRRWINEGKIQSKREGNRLFVLVDIADTEAVKSGQGADIQADTAIIEQVKRENELLRQQLSEKDKQIGNLQEELSKQSQRSDMIAMQITRLLESQMMIDAPKTKRRNWLHRLFFED